jgi:hypothetical protein
MNNRLRALLFAGIGLLAIVITVLVVMPRNNATALSKLVRLPANFMTSDEYANNDLLFSNGRSFVDYNYKTGKSTLLSDDALDEPLDNIDAISLSENKQYIVFHLPLVAADSQLESQLIAKGLDTNADYWWVYNIAAKTFQNFPADAKKVQVNGDEALAYTGDDASTITTYTLPDLRVTSTIHVSTSGDFLKTKDGYLLAGSEGGDISFTRDGVVSETVFTNANLIGITNDKHTVIGTSSQNGSTYLMSYDTSTKKQTILDSDINSQVGYVGGNKILYRKADSKVYYVYDLTTKKIDSFKLDAKSSPSSLVPEALLDNGSLLLSDKDNNMYVAGNTVANVKDMKSYNKNIGTASVEYFSDNNNLIATVDKASAESERQDIYGQLKKDGYDPNMLTIKFVLFKPGSGTL